MSRLALRQRRLPKQGKDPKRRATRCRQRPRLVQQIGLESVHLDALAAQQRLYLGIHCPLRVAVSAVPEDGGRPGFGDDRWDFGRGRASSKQQRCANRSEIRTQRLKALMQPPATRAAEWAHASTDLVEKIEHHQRSSPFDRCQQCRIVAEPQVVPQPDNAWPCCALAHCPTIRAMTDYASWLRRIRSHSAVRVCSSSSLSAVPMRLVIETMWCRATRRNNS